MRDSSMIQLVIEVGGATLLALGAAFTVYWNLLGKKYRSGSKQHSIVLKQQVSRARNPALQPAMQLNRTR